MKTDHKTTLPECSYTEARSADMQRFRMRLMRFHSKEIKYMSVKERRSTWPVHQAVKSTNDNDKMHAHIGSVISSQCPPQKRDYSRSWKHWRMFLSADRSKCSAVRDELRTIL